MTRPPAQKEPTAVTSPTTTPQAVPAATSTSGLLAGLGAYAIWGAFPAFFGLLTFLSPLEVVAHRIVWTVVLMLAVLGFAGHLGELKGLPRRTWGMVAAASLFISINWGMYVFAVATGHVVEAALGYFINPLVSVLFGVIVFKESINRVQICAVILAAVAVAVLTADYGRPPWIALTLAMSFASYGVVKKLIPLRPAVSLTAEGLVALPAALTIVMVALLSGTPHAFSFGPAQTLLVLCLGPITAAPLLLFGRAAQAVPLVTLGILQYLTPGMQMTWGILVVHEDMPPARWAGFTLIWIALAVFTANAVISLGSSRRVGRVDRDPTFR